MSCYIHGLGRAFHSADPPFITSYRLAYLLSRPRAEESTLFLVSARITNLCPLAVGERWLRREKEWSRAVRQVVAERSIKVDVVDAAVRGVVLGLEDPVAVEEVGPDPLVGQRPGHGGAGRSHGLLSLEAGAGEKGEKSE